MRRRLAWRLGYFPRYNRLVTEVGFIKEASLVRRYWLMGDIKRAEESVSDNLMDTFVIAGSPDECKDSLEKFVKAGIRLPIIYPYAVDKDSETALATCMKTFAS